MNGTFGQPIRPGGLNLGAPTGAAPVMVITACKSKSKKRRRPYRALKTRKSKSRTRKYSTKHHKRHRRS